MALSEAQKKAIEKDSGVKDAFKAGDKAAASALANIALFTIPGGGIVRVARVGGKIAPTVLKRISSLGGKRVTKPTARQLSKAKPLSSLKPSGTSVTKGPGTSVKPKGTAVGSRTGSGSSASNKSKIVGLSTKGKAAVGLLAGAGVVASLDKEDKDKGSASASSTNKDKKPTPSYRGGQRKPAPKTYRGGQRKPADKKNNNAPNYGLGKMNNDNKPISSPKSRPKRPPVKPKTNNNAPNYGLGKAKKDQNAPNYGLGEVKKDLPKNPRKGPGVGKQDKEDKRKNFKSTPVKNAALPAGAKPFKGGYDKKTHKLQNIRGKTYVVPKPKTKRK